jgi:hypothetical protein
MAFASFNPVKILGIFLVLLTKSLERKYLKHEKKY